DAGAGRFEDEHGAGRHQGRERLQEGGEQQRADGDAVNISIGRNDRRVVAESIQPVFNVQRVLQQVELFVLVNNLFGQSETVEGLAPQTEYRLGFYVTRLCYRSAGRISFCDEDHRLLPLRLLLVVEVVSAIAQLTVV